MGIIVDIIIIAIIALSIFLGYKKGLIELSVKLFAFLIAIIITFLIYKPVSNLIINVTNIDETIQNFILEKANDVMSGEQENKELTGEIKEQAKEGILPDVARTLSVNIVTGGVIVLLYILLRIALKFVTALANLVAKLPILKQFNKGGGAVYGALRGVLMIYVVLIIVSLFGQINSENSVHQNIEKSYIGKLMYENNILNVFFVTR